MLQLPLRRDLELMLAQIGPSPQILAASATGADKQTMRDVEFLLGGRTLKILPPAAKGSETTFCALPSTVEHAYLCTSQQKMLQEVGDNYDSHAVT